MKTAIQWLALSTVYVSDNSLENMFDEKSHLTDEQSTVVEIFSTLKLGKVAILSFNFSGIFVGPVIFLNSWKRFYPMPHIVSFFHEKMISQISVRATLIVRESMNFTVRKSKNIFQVGAPDTSSSYIYH